MAISTITSGQKDWLSVLNNDLTELNNRDSGTWTSTGMTGMNGYTLNNCRYFYGRIGGRNYLMINGQEYMNLGTMYIHLDN